MPRYGKRLRTGSIHSCSHVQLRDMIGGGLLQPDSLPNARARAVEDMAGVTSLFPDGYDLGIGRIIYKDRPWGSLINVFSRSNKVLDAGIASGTYSLLS